MNLCTMKLAHWDKTQSRELSGLFICVCIALCTIVAHNIAQNRPDNFHSWVGFNVSLNTESSFGMRSWIVSQQRQNQQANNFK